MCEKRFHRNSARKGIIPHRKREERCRGKGLMGRLEPEGEKKRGEPISEKKRKEDRCSKAVKKVKKPSADGKEKAIGTLPDTSIRLREGGRMVHYEGRKKILNIIP